MYLIEVDDCNESMRVQVSIDAVVDGRQVDHQVMSAAGAAVQVADGPRFDQLRGSVLIQHPTSVWVCRRSRVDADAGDAKQPLHLEPLHQSSTVEVSERRLDADRHVVEFSDSPRNLHRHE